MGRKLPERAGGRKAASPCRPRCDRGWGAGSSGRGLDVLAGPTEVGDELLDLLVVQVLVGHRYLIARQQSLGVGIFLTYLVPPTLLFLPLSRVVAELDLHDRLWSLILVYPSFTVPFSIWLLMGFFKTIPPDLEDAALVDGASRLTALVRVVFPLSVPGILTVVIFSFSLVVNEFVYAITFISSTEQKTISAGVPTELIRGDVFYWGALMAATLIPAIPLALLYNVFLNRFIAGFTGGAFR